MLMYKFREEKTNSVVTSYLYNADLASGEVHMISSNQVVK